MARALRYNYIVIFRAAILHWVLFASLSLAADPKQSLQERNHGGPLPAEGSASSDGDSVGPTDTTVSKPSGAGESAAEKKANRNAKTAKDLVVLAGGKEIGNGLDGILAAAGEQERKEIEVALENNDVAALAGKMNDDLKAAAALISKRMSEKDPAKFTQSIEALHDAKKGGKTRDKLGEELTDAMREQAKELEKRYSGLLAKGMSMAPGVPEAVLASRMAEWDKLLKDGKRQEAGVAIAQQLGRMQNPKQLIDKLGKADQSAQDSDLGKALKAAASRMDFSPQAQDPASRLAKAARPKSDDPFDAGVDKQMKTEYENRTLYNKLKSEGKFAEIQKHFGESFNLDWALATGDVQAAYFLGNKDMKGDGWKYEPKWNDFMNPESKSSEKFASNPVTFANKGELAGVMKKLAETPDKSFNAAMLALMPDHDEADHAKETAVAVSKPAATVTPAKASLPSFNFSLSMSYGGAAQPAAAQPTVPAQADSSRQVASTPAASARPPLIHTSGKSPTFYERLGKPTADEQPVALKTPGSANVSVGDGGEVTGYRIVRQCGQGQTCREIRVPIYAPAATE